MMEESGAHERWCDGVVEGTRVIAVLPRVTEASVEQKLKPGMVCSTWGLSTLSTGLST